RAEAIHLVISTEHANHGRAVRGRARDLSLVGRRGDKDKGAQPVARGGRRDRSGQVSCRRARDRVEAELERPREGGRDRATFERERWITRVVLADALSDAVLATESRACVMLNVRPPSA